MRDGDSAARDALIEFSELSFVCPPHVPSYVAASGGRAFAKSQKPLDSRSSVSLAEYSVE
jgi:hypothetical protein